MCRCRRKLVKYTSAQLSSRLRPFDVHLFFAFLFRFLYFCLDCIFSYVQIGTIHTNIHYIWQYKAAGCTQRQLAKIPFHFRLSSNQYLNMEPHYLSHSHKNHIVFVFYSQFVRLVFMFLVFFYSLQSFVASNPFCVRVDLRYVYVPFFLFIPVLFQFFVVSLQLLFFYYFSGLFQCLLCILQIQVPVYRLTGSYILFKIYV